jgi:tRNA A37 methylthiotransferase MiaB
VTEPHAPTATLPPAAPRVAIRTLGCKVNRSESDQLAEQLLASGIAVIDDEAASDVIVINSCTVTGEADAKTRKAVRRALAAPGEPTVVVTGCMAVLDADALRGLGSRVIVESEKTLVVACVLRALEGADVGDARREILQGGEGSPAEALTERRMSWPPTGDHRRSRRRAPAPPSKSRTAATTGAPTA